MVPAAQTCRLREATTRLGDHAPPSAALPGSHLRNDQIKRFRSRNENRLFDPMRTAMPKCHGGGAERLPSAEASCRLKEAACLSSSRGYLLFLSGFAHSRSRLWRFARV